VRRNIIHQTDQRESSLLIWDEKGDPPTGAGLTLCWQSYARGERLDSVPRYLESHAQRLRAKYLEFIHDLGEHRIAGRRVIDHLDAGEGFSFWWMTRLAEKSPLKSPRIYDCLRLLALEELLADNSPCSVTLASADGRLAQAVRRLCDNLALSFRHQPIGAPKRAWSLRRCYEALPFSVRALLSLRYVLSRRALRRTAHPAWFAEKGSVFFCSYFIHLDPISCARGEFYSRQWESLPKTLHDSGRSSNWLQIFISSPVVPDAATGAAWLEKFNADARNQGCQAFVHGYATFTVVLKAIRKWLWLNSVSWKLRGVQSAFSVNRSAVWLWPVLRDDWRTSLAGPTAMENCLWRELFDSAIASMPHQETGLYLCENQAWERSFLHAWRKYGHGKIIGVQHSTVPFWHLYNFDDPRTLADTGGCAVPLPDCLAVNGADARRAFLEAGFPAQKLVEVEALRYLNLLAVAKEQAVKPPPSGAMRVIVLGDMIPGSMRMFLDLVAAAAKRLPTGYEFTFKPHPGYSINLAEFVDLKAAETTEPLHRILDRFDVAITANSTSASIDAYVAGLPVIIALRGDDLNLSPLRGSSGLHFVTSPAELMQALEAIRTGSASIPSDREGLFHLNAELPRWRALLTPSRRATAS
jgi:surface carbohydrate biosynthesis protein (TIGR04326 family)